MSLIQPLKFRTWETGHLKMPHFETPHLQMAIFQTVVTVASRHRFACQNSNLGKRLQVYIQKYGHKM